MDIESYIKVSQNALIYRFAKNAVIAIILGFTFGGFFMLGGMKSVALAVLVVVIIFFLIQLIPSFLEYNNLGYQLESNSVNFRKGLLSIQNTTIPFARITNASFNQSFFQRLFSVGDLVIDQEDAGYTWKGIDSVNADKINHAISSKSNLLQTSKVK